MSSTLTTFNKSLERCLAVPDFVRTFYIRFVGSSEEVKEKFSYTNFEEQQIRLENALRVLPLVMAGDQDALRHLSEVAESHNSENLKVRPELYVLWQSILLLTVDETDPECSPEILEAWTVITDDAIKFMTKRY